MTVERLVTGRRLRVLRWLLAHKHARDIGGELLPLLVQQSEKAVFARRFPLVVPFFRVTSDLVRVICLDSQK